MKIRMEISALEVGKEIGTNGSDLDLYALLMAVEKSNPEGYAKAIARMERRAERKAAEQAPRMTLGETLREHMHAKRLTRREMAAAMGISYPYLCELLHDKKTPGKTALEGLTRAGVDTSRVQF